MKKLIAGACAIFLLSACQRDTAATAQQLPQYRKAVLDLLPGTYDGSCPGADGGDRRENIVIDGTGVASAPGWKADLLRGAEVLILSRSIGESRALGIDVSGSDRQASAAPEGTRAPALPHDTTGRFRCVYGASANTLGEKTLYSVVAPYFKRGTSTLTCTSASTQTSERVQVQASDQGIRVGSRVLSFVQGVKIEHIHLDIKGGKLSYAAEYDGQLVGVTVDGSGKISEVTTGGSPDSIGCALVPSE